MSPGVSYGLNQSQLPKCKCVIAVCWQIDFSFRNEISDKVRYDYIDLQLSSCCHTVEFNLLAHSKTVIDNCKMYLKLTTAK